MSVSRAIAIAGISMLITSAVLASPSVSFEGVGEDSDCLYRLDGGSLVLNQQDLGHRAVLVDIRTVNTSSGFFSSPAQNGVQKVKCTLRIKATSSKKIKLSFSKAYLSTVRQGLGKKTISGSMFVKQSDQNGKKLGLVSGNVADPDLMMSSFRRESSVKFSECGTQHQFEIGFAFSWLGESKGNFLTALNGPMFVLQYEPC